MKVKKPVFDRPHVAYLNCVYADDEFKAFAQQIIDDLDFKDGDTVGYLKEHGKRLLVVNDYDHKLSDELMDRVARLASDYDLSLIEVMDYFNGYAKGHDTTVLVDVYRSYDPTDNPHFTIEVLPGATKRDVLKELDDFDGLMERAYGSSRKRDKGPENYPLVYAIHRERKAGKTFSAIHADYMNRTLPRYKGSASITSLVKFRQYYSKYKPKGTT